MILDTAGTVLPEGIRFLGLGWWTIHAMAILFTYLYAYRKGRGDEKRLQRAKEMEGKK